MKGSTSGRSTKKLLNRNLHRNPVLWTQLLSIITSIVCIGIVSKKYPGSTAFDVKYTSLASLSFWLLGDIINSVNIPYQEFLNVVFRSISLSIILIIFLIFIRERKPIIFRYPYYMVFIPLLIPIAQFIVMDTQIIREIIFMSLQGVSILVYSLLSVAYAKEIKNKLVTLVGIILLLGGFTFFWILKEHYIVFEWSWALTNSLGVIASVFSFSDLLTQNEDTLNQTI